MPLALLPRTLTETCAGFGWSLSWAGHRKNASASKQAGRAGVEVFEAIIQPGACGLVELASAVRHKITETISSEIIVPNRVWHQINELGVALSSVDHLSGAGIALIL